MGSALDADTLAVANLCLFGDGDLATHYNIQSDLGDFYTLMDDIDSAVDEMTDPNGDIQKMADETSPVIASLQTYIDNALRGLDNNNDPQPDLVQANCTGSIDLGCRDDLHTNLHPD
jgi:hypothetical protein